MERTQMLKVVTPYEGKDGKTHWQRLGVAFPNKDGSTNVYLNSLPVNGKLQIRDLDEDDLRARGRRDGGVGAGFGGGAPASGLSTTASRDDLPF
jgi:hypothetical protein